jgi:hypothetical protein
LDAKIDDEVDSLHVKRIGIEDLVGYVYIVRVDKALKTRFSQGSQHPPVVGHQIMEIQQLASSVVAANCGLLCPRQEQKPTLATIRCISLLLHTQAHALRIHHSMMEDPETKLVPDVLPVYLLQDSHWIPL